MMFVWYSMRSNHFTQKQYIQYIILSKDPPDHLSIRSLILGTENWESEFKSPSSRLNRRHKDDVTVDQDPSAMLPTMYIHVTTM